MQDVLTELTAFTQELETRLGALTDEQLDRKPADGGWSGRETAGHLVITVRGYDEKLQGLIERHPEGRRASDKPPRRTLFGRLLLGMLPNPARTFKAPKTFDPAQTGERFTVEDLIEVHRVLYGTGEALARLNLGSRKFGTPVSRFLRLRAREAIAVQVQHGRRHLKQILRAAGLADEAAVAG